MKRIRAAAALFLLLVCTDLSAAEPVRIVRYKLSAGDLASGEAAVETYRRTTGVDAEYLDAVGCSSCRSARPSKARELRGFGLARG